MTKREHWEQEIIYHIIDLFEVTNSDAQGIFEAHSFEVTQGWGKASLPIEVAKLICNTDSCS